MASPIDGSASKPGLPLRNWIANLDGEPVAAAALFVGADVAGIYNVCTVPEARGRGIGAAVTRRRLDAAVAQGLELAVLGASDMGYPVYRRLGFREVSRLRSYALSRRPPGAEASGDRPGTSSLPAGRSGPTPSPACSR